MTASPPFNYLWQERGKTVCRSLTNWVLQQWRNDITGLVLDLGSGYSPSYWRLLALQKNPSVRLVSLDGDLRVHPTIVGDLSRSLPFKDGIADSIILGGVLMLLADPVATLNEAKRLLKPGGFLALYSALVFSHNPDPHDYWRFTEEGLKLLLERAGFADIAIVAVGGRWTAAAYLLSPFLRPHGFVGPLAYWLCGNLDRWTESHSRLAKCPIGYTIRARRTR